MLCGWGRSVGFEMNNLAYDNWFIEAISSFDLTVLSHSSEFKALDLWRLIVSKRKFEEHNTEISNVNGLLNLYAWAKSLDFHLIPHHQFQDVPYSEKPGLITIQTNSLRDARYEYYFSVDEHQKINPYNNLVRLQKSSGQSFFKEEKQTPLYISVTDALDSNLLSVYEGEKIDWWCTIQVNDTENSSSDLIYRIWDAATRWLAKATPILEREINITNRFNSVLWELRWKKIQNTEAHVLSQVKVENLDDLNIKIQNNKISVLYPDNLIPLFYSEYNDAERKIILGFVIGINDLFALGLNNSKIELLVSQIMNGRDARFLHFFIQENSLEYLSQNLVEPILISKFDDAIARIGLGWLDHSPAGENKILGVEACCSYLNKMVDKVWLGLKEKLSFFDRESLIISLLENICSIYKNTLQWNRTIRASLACHLDKEDVLSQSGLRKAELNGGLMASRLAIEIAICECPQEHGKTHGKLEIAEILQSIALLHNLGLWSDAIKFGMIEPELVISSFGEIMFNQYFFENVVTPYGKAINSKMLSIESKNYSRYFSEQEELKSIEGFFDKNFIRAWEEEFGFSIDTLRNFAQLLEEYSVEKGEIILKISLNEIADISEHKFSISTTHLHLMLDYFSLFPRKSWDFVPDGFSSSDWYPWKYGRRLSLVARPIIKLDEDTENPTYLICSYIFTQSYIHVLRSTYEADFDDKYFKSKIMRKWIGKKRNITGHQFNKDVANALIEIGWEAISDIKSPALLNKKFDTDYGDIDVFAWNKANGRVLAIECKDLQFAKTSGEIAAQINEFRGVITPKGKPDRLKKHLIRIDELNKNKHLLKKNLHLHDGVKIETHLVFSNIVPMAYFDDPVFQNVRVTFFDSLRKI